MAKEPDHKPLYAAAEQFVDQCLRQDGSLFTPGKAIWTLAAANDLYDRFVVNANLGGGSFDEKLTRQLEEAGPQTIQFAAELVYVFLFIPFPGSISAPRKRQHVHRILDLLPEPIEVPRDLDEAFRFGVAGLGRGIAQLDRYVSALLQLIRTWKEMAPTRHSDLLSNPWDFKASVRVLGKVRVSAVLDGLLHLVFPDTFEPTVSVTQKQLIAKRFSYLVTVPTDDVDRQLLQIREQLQTKDPKHPFSFYEKLMRPAWDPTRTPWDCFIYWAARLYHMPEFNQSERDYKIEIADLSRQARDALRAGQPEWLDILKRAFGPVGNLVNWRASQPFLNWCRDDGEAASTALRAVWDGSNELPARLEKFLHMLPADVAHGTSARLSIATNLLLGSDAEGLPPYRYEPIHSGYRLTDYPAPDSKASETEVYLHALAFLDKIITEAKERGLELRDRLDAQSVLWAITKDDSLWKAWPEAERQYLDEYRSGTGGAGLPIDDAETLLESEDTAPPEVAENLALTIEALADDLLLDAGWLRDVERLLEAKKQIIVYGPPGTGKTYVAMRLAQYLVGNLAQPSIVQLHPSYAYEDFVQGFRPHPTEGGQPGFNLVDGPLLRTAHEARANPGLPTVLIIDEINRGNLARVLGELYFLLEYRDRQISLQYSDKPFALPDNLWIIGTMNTSDRSIALIDAALRRRFFFVPFFPDALPVRGLLGRWLERNHPDLLWVAAVVDRANDLLNDRHLSVGPSYFMRDDLDEDWVRRIWAYQIIPYIEEQYFDDPEKVREFDLDKLRGRLPMTHSLPDDEAPGERADAPPVPD